MQAELSSRRYYRWLIFAVVAAGTFMSTLTSSIVNVALPDVMGALGTDLALVQWVVSAYLLAITSLLPLAGRLGDLYGRRNIYGWGFLIFITGSFFCGLSQSITALIAARLVQAVGAAALMANAPAIVAAGFPLSQRGKVLGMTGTAVALGTLVGPSLGGIIVEKLSWNWVFWVNIPVGVVGYIGARVVLPLDTNLLKESIDYIGALLFSAGMTAFLLVLSHGAQWGWATPGVTGLIGAAVFSFALFIWHENRTPHPMLDLSIFRNWPFLAGNLSGALSFMALFANTMLLPFYLHEVLLLPPIRIGLIMSAFPIVMAVVAPFSGALSDKMGSRALSAGGLGLLALGCIYMAKLPADAGLSAIVAGQALMGLGNGLFQSPNNNSVMSAVRPAQMGVAGGISALARNFGMVSGTAIAVSIFELRKNAFLASVGGDVSQINAAYMAGYHDALTAAAFIAALGLLTALVRQGPTAQN